jgi:hypothetical protein
VLLVMLAKNLLIESTPNVTIIAAMEAKRSLNRAAVLADSAFEQLSQQTQPKPP